jgi:hypothetical protein
LIINEIDAKRGVVWGLRNSFLIAKKVVLRKIRWESAFI